MKTLYVFMLAIAALLFVDALPYVPSKVTIPLKKKRINRPNARKFDRRATLNVDVSLQPPPTQAYYGELIFGKSGVKQTFNIQFNTGTADFWVIGQACYSPACVGKPQYDNEADTSYVDLKQGFTAKYADGGMVTGSSGTTFIQIGDHIANQRIGYAYMLTDNFQNDEFVGMMGMAFDSASNNNQITLLSNLFNDGNNGFDAKQFSFKLGRIIDETDTSELTIGGTNPSSYTGMITWTHLSDNNRGLWIIPLDDCLVNGKALNLAGRVANLDTGTTLINMPHADALQVYANIQHEEKDGHFYISCDNDDIVSLKINGVTWDIDPVDFIIEEDDDKCYGAINGVNDGSANEWTLGVAFLTNVYSVFDLGNLQIGLAKVA